MAECIGYFHLGSVDNHHHQEECPNDLQAVEFPTILDFIGLPATPSVDELVYYIPFNDIVRWDGTHWAATKITKNLFGRQGFGNFPTWLRAAGRADVFPKNIGGVQVLGLYSVTFTEGIAWKLYNITAKSDRIVTGDLEIHEDSGSLVPVFGSTGKALVPFINSRTADVQLGSPPILSSGSRLQCYMRRTAGVWDNLSVILTLSKVAAAP